MKNSIKRILFVIIILILLISINTESLAWSSIVKSGKDFVQMGERQEKPIEEGPVKEVSSYLYNILLAAGVVISVIIATILGIQFMIGGAEGQAKVKEMLLPYIVGCIIVFGGFAFWKIAVDVGKKIDGVGKTMKIDTIEIAKTEII